MNAIFEPVPTITETPTATATATILWFPPTATPTPLVLVPISPTPTTFFPIGEQVYAEDFSETTHWLGQSREARGSVVIENNQLTITIAQPKTQLASINSALNLTDFYVEVTSMANLCSGLDEYGIIFRMKSGNDLYRFTLSCNGQVRLTRVLQGKISFPQPWMPSGAVPIGAPGYSRIGVWLSGQEMRFFINGEHQFTHQEANVFGGKIGLFARASGENAVSISFTDMIIYQVIPYETTTTPEQTQQPNP